MKESAKKYYVAPAIEVVNIEVEQSILAASYDDESNSRRNIEEIEERYYDQEW